MKTVLKSNNRSGISLICFFGGLLLLLGQNVKAQTYTIWGQVDANGLSLANVRVVAARSKAEVVTDETGKFKLTVTEQDSLTLIHPTFSTRGINLPLIDRSANFYFDFVTNQVSLKPYEEEHRNTTPTVGSPGPSQPKIPSFPWPVPPPSADVVLDSRFFTSVRTLAQADKRLKDALEKSGYPNPHYYQIPNGFAMVGQLEQTERDGTPKPPPARWSTQVYSPFSQFKLSNYLQLLYKAATGYFRVIVFLVTDMPPEKSQNTVSDTMAKSWYTSGVSFLPAAIGQQLFTGDYRVTALIYEFEKPENSKVRFLSPSISIGQDHLSKSKITEYLAK